MIKIESMMTKSSQLAPAMRKIGQMEVASLAGPVFSGPIWVIDHCDGAQSHVFSARLTDGLSRQSLTVGGSVSGFSFLRTPERRGAPRKDARNMAVLLAYKWFYARDQSAPERGRAMRAKSAVVDLWTKNGWKGVTEESHVTSRLRAQEAILKQLRASLLSHVCDDGLDGCLLAGESPGFTFGSSEVSFSGKAWWWRYGSEHANFGYVAASIPLSHSQS